MKQKVIREITKLMHQHEISINDLEIIMNTTTKFDLLCEVNGNLVRLPFDKGVNEKIIGIFHSKHSNMFLYVNETSESLRVEANEFKIPTIRYWEDIFKIKEELNNTLINLGFDEIDGRYFARSMHLTQANWIVRFSKNLDRLTSDYYENRETAKIRYFGLFQK